MSLIPESIRREWRKAAHKRDCLELNLLLSFRDILDENLVNGIPRHPIGDLYAEAAEDMGYRKNTLERKMRTIRGYSREQLEGWLNRGLSYDHIETANAYQEYPPAHLLDKAIELGSRDGNKPMTVEEMDIFANGGKPITPNIAFVERTFTFLGKVPQKLGWDVEKTSQFFDELIAFRRRWAL